MAAILGNLWPLGGNTKDRKVASRYLGDQTRDPRLSCPMLTTALPHPRWTESKPDLSIYSF